MKTLSRLSRAGGGLVFCSSPWCQCHSIYCAMFPCMQNTGNVPSCPTGHFGKLCCLYNSSGVFSWRYCTSSEYQCHSTPSSCHFRAWQQSKHSISPAQGMLLKSSLLLKMGFWYKTKKCETQMVRSSFPFLTIHSSGGTNNFLFSCFLFLQH